MDCQDLAEPLNVPSSSIKPPFLVSFRFIFLSYIPCFVGMRHATSPSLEENENSRMKAQQPVAKRVYRIYCKILNRNPRLPLQRLPMVCARTRIPRTFSMRRIRKRRSFTLSTFHAICPFNTNLSMFLASAQHMLNALTLPHHLHTAALTPSHTRTTWMEIFTSFKRLQEEWCWVGGICRRLGEGGEVYLCIKSCMSLYHICTVGYVFSVD